MADPASEVRRLLQRAIRAGTAPAAVAQWGRAGVDMSCEAFGVSTLSPDTIEVRTDTWFDLASLTKPLVTTTLSLLAFRSGVIGPHTRVGEVLHEVSGSGVDELEIEHLLTHTAGLPAWLPLYSLAEGKPDALAGRLAGLKVQARPGERVIYSCVGFVILGLILARVAGEGLASLFRREVLRVVGLEGRLDFTPDPETHSLVGGTREPVVESSMAAELGFDPAWIPPLATGLPDDGNARFLGGVSGNSGLFGTASGVARLASEFLPGGGALLSAAEASAATVLRTKGLEQGRAWGWQLASTPGCSAGEALTDNAFGHTGFTGVSVWCEPATNGVHVLLTNRNHPWQRENDLHPLRRRFHAVALV